MASDGTEYRIELSIQRKRPGDDDFGEVGFASSGGWSSLDQAAHMVVSAIQNREWETTGDMPDPDEVDPSMAGLD